MNLKEFILGKAERGYCFFLHDEAKKSLECSDIALRRAISRSQKKGELAEPLRGFHLIIPPEYKNLGCLPAEQFIPDLMQYLNINYYVCLLSAAQYHGAAHHRPQVFQVMADVERRKIKCGKVVIDFMTKKKIAGLPVKNINTKQGFLAISSPELTALDLVSYPDRAGGLDNVFSVISELANKINAENLTDLWLHQKETTWLQRLGYLFELAGHYQHADSIESFLKNKRFQNRPLSLSNDVDKDATLNMRWKLWLNEDIEADT